MTWVLLLLGIAGAIAAGLVLRKWLKMLRLNIETKAQDKIFEERRRFISRLDHELKNPLTAMRVELANLAATDDPGERRQIRENIQGQIIRLSQLVANLRKLTYLDSGQLDRFRVDMNNVLQQIIQSTKDHPDAKDRVLHFPVIDELAVLPGVMGDEDLLHLAIYNLIDNAMKFTHPGDTVQLRAYEEAGEIVIEVEDSGQGIPEEEAPYVWEELFRSREAHGIPGSGLGLAMVKNIIENHDGTVDLQSESNRYTLVTLRLPTTDE